MVKTENPRMGRPVSNRNSVAHGIWSRWNNTARRTFNITHARMRSQLTFIHPQATLMRRKHWDEIRWNAAMAAADASMGIK